MELRVAVPDVDVDDHVIAPVLESVTRYNEKLIRAGKVPPFDEAVKKGLIEWRPEPEPGIEKFDHAGIVLARGWGDCDDLGPYAAASMRVLKQDEGATPHIFESAPSRWHAIVHRSDGSKRDPSKEAGMKTVNGIGLAAVPLMYQPSSVSGLEARPTIGVRRIVTPRGNVGYDARVDLPFVLSSDYALSGQARRRHMHDAIVDAIMGACGPAMAAGCADPEHLKVLDAIGSIVCGEDPQMLMRQVGRRAVERAIPFVETVSRDLHADVGFNFGKFLKGVAKGVAPLAHDIEHAAGHLAQGAGALATFNFKALERQANALVHDIKSATHDIAPALKFYETILSEAQALVSLIPGIGTGISSAIGVALELLHGGGPLEIALRAAYDAIPIPPGIKNVTDSVFSAAVGLIHTKDLSQAAIEAVRAQVPGGLPKQVFDTLAHIIVHAISGKPTIAIATVKTDVDFEVGPGAQIHPRISGEYVRRAA